MSEAPLALDKAIQQFSLVMAREDGHHVSKRMPKMNMNFTVLKLDVEVARWRIFMQEVEKVCTQSL